MGNIRQIGLDGEQRPLKEPWGLIDHSRDAPSMRDAA